jgi:PmbA protein
MDKAVEILELVKAHVTSAEAFTISSEAVKVAYKGGKVRSSEVQESSGVSIRAIQDGKLGFYSTTDLTDKPKLLDSVLTSTRYGGEAGFEFAAPQSGELFEGFSQETSRLDIGELAELGRRLAAKIEEKTNREEMSVEVNLERRVYDQHLVNTNGVDQKQKRSLIEVVLVAQRVRGNDVLFTYSVSNSIAPDANIEKLSDQLLWKLGMAENLVALDTKEGRLPVVFTPPGSALLFFPLYLGLSGKNAFKGVSPLAGKVGEAVLDPRLNLTDDPFMANRPASTPYDAEGVATRRQTFFDKGVLTGFYYDLKSAGEASVQSTGHGRREGLAAPQAGLSNPAVLGGDSSFQELISDIKEGLLVDSVLGMGQSNILGGAFNNSVGLAYKIENGEIVGRVKDVSIAGNVYDLLKNNLGGLSRETELVFGQLNLPYVRIDGLSTVSNH